MLLGLVLPTSGASAGAADQAAPAARKNEAAGKDEAERQKVFSSREWREMRHAFNEWLSVQKIYSPAEVKKIRVELNAKIARMSSDQLRDFLEDTKEKMAILMSKEAEQARVWLAQRMAVEVRATPEQIKELRPDVVHMTAAQLEESLQKLEAERAQVRQTQTAFDKGRREQVKSIAQTEREEQREREHALNRAYSDLNTPYGNYYRPNNNPGNVRSPFPYDVGTPFEPEAYRY